MVFLKSGKPILCSNVKNMSTDWFPIIQTEKIKLNEKLH